MSGWWWYPFIKNEDRGRGMRVPTRAELKSLAELREESEKQFGADTDKVLQQAVYAFMHSRDEEVSDHYAERTRKDGKTYTQHWEDAATKPWDGVGSMWALFLSQAPIWIEQGREDKEVWWAIDRMLAKAEDEFKRRTRS